MSFKAQINVLDEYASLLSKHCSLLNDELNDSLKTWPEAFAFILVESHYMQKNRIECNFKHLEYLYENYQEDQKEYLYEIICDGTGNYPLSSILVEFISKTKEIESQFKSLSEFVKLFGNASEFASFIHSINSAITKKQALRVSYKFGFDFYWPSHKLMSNLGRLGLTTKFFDIDRYQFIVSYVSSKSGLDKYFVHKKLNSYLSSKNITSSLL
jgi:hypothetical protein